MVRPRTTLARRVESFSTAVTHWTGTTPAFALAALSVVVWAALGPLFAFSTTWQLVINTGTTIMTFLMVFLIQRAQNKDALAIQLKLNELVAAIDGANNRLISVEDLDEQELEALHRFYRELAALAKREERVSSSHSVEEARRIHRRKAKR